MYQSASFSRHLRQCISALLIAGLLSACISTPPTLNASTIKIPEKWQNKMTVQRATSSAWWLEIGSAELNSLIDQALQANRDIQIAVARVAQARAIAGETESDRQLQVNAVAGSSRGRQTILDPKSTVSRVGLQASWELDVLGQKGLASRAAQLDAESAELAHQGAQTIVAAEVTTAYLDAAILTRREALGRQRLAVLEQSIDTVKKQFVAGLTTQVEINRQEAAHRAYAAELAQLGSARQQRLLQLAVLLGATPGSIQPTFNDFDRIQFAAPASLLPSELLEQRPDVQRSAKEVAAAAARLGVAKQDIYPKFVFSWSDAYEHAKVAGQSSSTGMALGYGVSITLPILDGGRIRSRIQINEARLQEAMAVYEKTMLEALANVESTLVQQTATQNSLASIKQTVTANEAGLNNTQRLFTAGQADKMAVLNSQEALLQAKDTLLQAQGSHWVSGVSVYRAFAGSLKLPE